MNTNYLRAFIIASSFIVVAPHFLAVANLEKETTNYTYEQYTFVAPVYYGIMNMISLFIAINFKLSRRMRYILIGTISPLIVTSFSYIFQTYTYTSEEWMQYAFGLFIKHFLIWNIIIYLLDIYV